MKSFHFEYISRFTIVGVVFFLNTIYISVNKITEKMSLFEVEGWGLENRKVKAIEKKKRKRTDNNNDDVNEKEISGLGLDKSKIPKKEKVKNENENENNDVVKDKENYKDKKDKRDNKDKRDKKRSKDNEDNNEDIMNKKPKMDMPPPGMPDGIDPSKLTPLQRKMLFKLSGSRFRWINEQLYTTTSENALNMIKKQPELYEEYHKGFASQVESWPENPVDVFTRELVYRGVNKMINSPGGLPGVVINGQKTIVVSDMGCGEANLAIQIDSFMDNYKKNQKEALKKFKKQFGAGKDVSVKNFKLLFKIHSFDLKKINDKITVADIKNVPMLDESCSVVIFCLSLMGTNFLDFIKEASRILIKGGELWITEIKSRISDPKCKEFIKAIENLGFKLRNFDDGNKMFTKFEFYKPIKGIKKGNIEEVRGDRAEGEWLLKPCIYKRR